MKTKRSVGQNKTQKTTPGMVFGLAILIGFLVGFSGLALAGPKKAKYRFRDGSCKTYFKRAQECGFLKGRRLDEKNFSSSNLRGAILRKASLRLVNFKNARLEGADLRKARLQGADLSQISIDKNTRFKGALFDAYTILPFAWGGTEAERISTAKEKGMKKVIPPFNYYYAIGKSDWFFKERLRMLSARKGSKDFRGTRLERPRMKEVQFRAELEREIAKDSAKEFKKNDTFRIEDDFYN